MAENDVQVNVQLRFQPMGSTPEFSPGGKIYAAMCGVMLDLEAVAKDKTNQDQNFKYRGIDGIYNSVHPSMVKNKVFSVTRVLKREVAERTTKSGGKMLHVTQEQIFRFFSGEDGSFVDVGPIISEGMDTSDKATNKCLAVAHKYAMVQVFAIPTEDQDDGDKEALQIGGDQRAQAARQTRPAAQPAVKPQGQGVKPNAPAPAAPTGKPGAQPAQGPESPLLAFWNLAVKRGWTEAQVKEYIHVAFQTESTKSLPDIALKQLSKIVEQYTFDHAIGEFRQEAPQAPEPEPGTFGAYQGGAPAGV